MAERRTNSRRILEKRPPEVTPAPDRRGGERRDSPRVPMRFLLRDLEEGGSYQEGEGDLSIGGVYWRGRYPAEGAQVEVRFRLPRTPRELRARGEIIRVEGANGALGYHVRFTDLDVESELNIARFLEQS
jgi:uncharacterized protein (TIGR02266 family)